MISYVFNTATSVPDVYGLSTDKKPTDARVHNGSRFIEVDSGNEYRFDAVNKVWYFVPYGNSGGDGTVVPVPGASADKFVLIAENGTMHWEEITEFNLVDVSDTPV